MEKNSATQVKTEVEGPHGPTADLGREGVAEISSALNRLLADVFALYLKTKSFHWHMTGRHFRDYHLLLDEHAEQIFAMTDDVAERVRKIGGTTLRSISDISRHQCLKDNKKESTSPEDMLTELRTDNRELTRFLRLTHEVCEKHNDVATANLIENWIDESERRTWFLSEIVSSSSDLSAVSLTSPIFYQGGYRMTTITTKDGTQIYYKDWGKGQPVVFSHGWPLSADAWEDQMVFLGAHGYRCIAHDRRGHGRSSQPWDGNEMDTYADDLAALVEALDLKEAVHVGHSTGGGEVARYIGRHGTKRVAKAVLIGAVPPLMLKTPANPGGLPIEAFDQIRAGVLADRSQFFKDLSMPFYGYNRPGAKVSEGLRDSFWLQGMLAGHKAVIDCIKAFSETDFTEDLKKFDVPTLVLHGDDDQIVPIGTSALLSSKIIKGATLKVIPGAPHGMCSTLKDQVNAGLLAFLKE